MATTTRSPEQIAHGRKVIGIVLLAGAATMTAGAVLVYSGILPVGEEVRGLLAGILVAVAAVDVFISLKFLYSFQQ